MDLNTAIARGLLRIQIRAKPILLRLIFKTQNVLLGLIKSQCQHSVMGLLTVIQTLLIVTNLLTLIRIHYLRLAQRNTQTRETERKRAMNTKVFFIKKKSFTWSSRINSPLLKIFDRHPNSIKISTKKHLIFVVLQAHM